MIIDKPKIDRNRVRAEEAELQRRLERLRKIIDLLAAGEVLGEPVREGDRIVVPVVRHRGPVPRYEDVVRRLGRQRLLLEAF